MQGGSEPASPTPPAAQRGASEPTAQPSPTSVRGASGDPTRGAYCTPLYVADACTHAGAHPFSLDPYSNERSHVHASLQCWLDRGDDGFGDGSPGSFLLAPGSARVVPQTVDVLSEDAQLLRATARTRTWLQPDYVRDFVLRAIRHYVHTRYVALLRFDPRTEWHDLIGEASEWIGVLSNSPGERSFEFEFPPGVTGAGNTFPHALYARSYADVTPEMRRLCSYPDGSARHWRKRSALADATSTASFVKRWGLLASAFAL